MTAIKTLKTISEKEGFTYKCSVISIHCGMQFIEINIFYTLISLHFFFQMK